MGSTNHKSSNTGIHMYWKKKPLYKWTCRVQICVVQRSCTPEKIRKFNRDINHRKIRAEDYNGLNEIAIYS